jgi:hypothetical protein
MAEAKHERKEVCGSHAYMGPLNEYEVDKTIYIGHYVMAYVYIQIKDCEAEEHRKMTNQAKQSMSMMKCMNVQNLIQF